MALSAEDRLALDYCAPVGIPLSVFNGRTVYPGDPMWLPEDRAAALDWHVENSTRCPGCGHSQAVTTSSEPPDYEVEAVVCHACMAKTREAQRMRETRGDDMGAIYFRVREAAD